MKANIYDLKGRFREVLNGEYEKDKFYYKTKKIFIFPGEEKYMMYNAEHSRQLPTGRFHALETNAFYVYDGKNYRQLTLEENIGEIDISGVLDASEKTELLKKAMVDAPFNWTKAIGFLLVICTIACIIGAYYAIQADYKMANSNPVQQNINKTINQVSQQYTYLQNQTKHQAVLYNETLQVCRAAYNITALRG